MEATRTGADVAVLQLADPALGTAINDVIVADGAAWFTDSFHPHLYRVPIGADGSIGTPSRLVVTGPAAHLSGDFNRRLKTSWGPTRIRSCAAWNAGSSP